ncbi:MAG: VOC family protein [Firmicutes bacterium]|nr:VOC family protein [Bacillota bacterium]
MRFDHLVAWVPELDEAVRAYRARGFHVKYGGEHPMWGTHNAVCHFGLPYVELIAVVDPALTPAGPAHIFRGAGRLLARGGGALTFAVAVSDVEAAAERLRERGLSVADPVPGERRRPDGTRLTWRMAPIEAGPSWRPFLIEWGEADSRRLASLREQGLDAPHPLGDLALDHLVIASRDPAADATWAARLTGRGAAPEGGVWRVPLPGCDLVLIAESGEPGIAEVVLRGPIPQSFDLFGLRVTVRPLG